MKSSKVLEKSLSLEISTNSGSGQACKPFHRNPHAHTKEKFRDISFLGPITLHRIFVVLWLVGGSVGFYHLQLNMWKGHNDWNVSTVWSWFPLIWLIYLPTSIIIALGQLMFRYPRGLDEVQACNYNVVFRITARGIQDECLNETIAAVRSAMARDALFPYLIEVVTDADVYEAEDAVDLIHIKVPLDYKTPNGTLYKARSQNYSLTHSTVPDDAWIVHLDEETRPLSSGIKGIARFIQQSEESGRVCDIGQGGMLYSRTWREFPFLTLADMIRTGGDMGMYYFQHYFGYILFSLHGAYIVVRNDIEKRVGFDLGRHGSLTEDGWWGILANNAGYRMKWIEGYLDEQSNETLMDFIKQRKRWNVGLLKTGIYCPVRPKFRVYMFFNALVTTLMPFHFPFSLMLSIALAVKIVPVPKLLLGIHAFESTAFLLVYMSGLVANMREQGTKWWQGIFWIVIIYIAIPFCTFLEATGGLMALLYPLEKHSAGFHVVRKSVLKPNTSNAAEKA